MKEKIIKFITSFKVIVVLTLISYIYFAIFASPRYESSAVVGVKSTDSTASSSSLIPLVGLTSSSKEDLMYLKEYIISYDMLKILQEKLNIKAIYSGKIDYELLFKDLDIKEDFLKYYQSKIKIVYDDLTGLMSINIQAFSPEDAKKIADCILKESERFINEISHKIAREQMNFAKEELEKASLELSKTQSEINQFQDLNSTIDPISQAKTQAMIKSQIEEKIIAKEVELATLNSYLNSNTPQVKALNSEINALKTQLKKEANKLTSKNKNDKLNYLVTDFTNLSFKLKFAEEAYKLALTSYEKARLDANKKIKQVIIISSPNLAETSVFPNIIYDVFSVFFILTLIFGIAKFIYSIIEEHRY